MSRKPLFVLLLVTGVTMAGVTFAEDEPAAAPQKSEEKAEKPEEAGSGTTAGNSGTTSGGEAEAKEPEQKGTGTGEAPDGQPAADQGPKKVSGMSILGNQEAPKSLVIVPWKSSEIGKALGISTLLDDSRRPIDKDVFMRELNYYEIRSEKKP